MSTLIIALPDPLDAALAERVAGELESILAERLEGPFEPLETDWKARVQSAAAKLTGA